MKLLKKMFSVNVELDPLETALLKSLETEPEHWEFVEKDGLIARHRGKSIIIRSAGTDFFEAWSDKLRFGCDFAKAWHSRATTIAVKRKSDADAVLAAAMKAQISRALGL
jgi:hypothetical protein